MTITTRMALLRRLARTKRRPSASEGVSIAVPLSFGVSRLLVEADNNTHLLFQNKLPICHRSFSLASSSYYCETHFQEEEEVPLISLDNVSLDYCTKKKKQTQQSKAIHANLRINRPQRGGHVLLGPNGSGKSLLSNALAQGFQEHRKAMKDADIEDPNTVSPEYFQKGSMAFSSDKMWHAQAMTHVSFESHEALIQPDEDGNILSVQKAITGGGNLNKAAQFLVVRFGLYPFLHREVNTLSTGEVRKVLLVKALANRPRLLVLDNAFDGLDVPSRDNLKELVSKTLNGFRPDILVQAVDAKTTAHTQIFMLTHRSEEIVDEISTVHYFENGELVTKDRKEDSGDRLLLDALQILEGPKTTHDVLQQAWKDPNLPSTDEISDWWKMERQSPEKYTNDTSSGPLVHCENLQIQRGDSVLLSDLNWNVQPGQHWWVAGGNGQGKSTLSRLVAQEEERMSKGTLKVANTSGNELKAGDRRKGVGWVSTESHMSLTRSPQTVREVLLKHSPQEDETPLKIGTAVLEWLEIPSDDDFLGRPFGQLSQGEQKLVLISAALASRPQLLVLDEPCQGLDLVKRKRILGVVERICQATDLSLIYITHHPEEVLPSVSHVLHLAKGQEVYQGLRKDYDPKAVAVKIERLELSNNDSSGKGGGVTKPGKRTFL